LLIAAPPTRHDDPDSRRVSGVRNGGVDFKNTPNKGEAGVELRFYMSSNYHKLTGSQKAELYQWRSEQKGKKSAPKPGNPQPPWRRKEPICFQTQENFSHAD